MPTIKGHRATERIIVHCALSTIKVHCQLKKALSTIKMFKVWAYIRHWLTAIDSRGHHIHSPYLFELVRLIIYDNNAYYCYRDIEHRRRMLKSNVKVIEVEDFGTGKSGKRVVGDIACTSLESTKVAQMLFRIVLFLRKHAQSPLNILELGTSLGITTAYLASTDSKSHVTTFEGSHAIAEVAHNTFNRLKLNNIEVVEGNIDITLPEYLTSHSEPVDFAFVDANHTCEATLRYVQALIPCCHNKSVIAIDDIHYSKSMEQAWRQLKQLEGVTTTMDFYHCGLLFFDKQYLKRNYKIRI